MLRRLLSPVGALAAAAGAPRSLPSRLLSSAPAPAPATVTMLYDGSCPMCAREVAFLKTLQRAPHVCFADISAPGFSPAPYTAKPLEALQAEMNVHDAATGTMHTRVDAFRKLYSTLGYNFLGFTRHWPFSVVADGAYTFLAAHKHRIAFLFK